MRKLLLLLIGVALFAVPALAQRIVTGKVTDEKGNPVANASVLIKGTTTGTITKSDGTFSFTVPCNARSVFISSVDMSAMEVVIGEDNHVDVTLRPEDKTMSEVVVTGYGTQRRREVT